MSDYLFDTTVFIDWWKGVPGAIVLFDDVINGHTTASYSLITSLEVYQFDSLGRQEEIEYEALCFLLEEVPVSSQVATVAGQMLRGLSRNQRRRLIADALIASTAMSRGEKVYSRNQRDIIRFYPDVETY